MQMFITGRWLDAADKLEVTNPYDGSVVDTVPKGTTDDIARAIAGLERGRETMRRMSAFERGRILERAATLVRARADDLARTISREEGKILAESRVEVSRGADVLQISAEEGRRIAGEMIPLDGASNGAGKLGFTLRVPCGIVGAISPFNFPLNLVTHKVGPAIAAGNAVLLKPATNTPLSALKLTEILLEAGLPEEAIACVTGPGSELGEAICRDNRIRKISFTGSYAVGDRICRAAGVKRVTMELGSNSPVIIMDDADIELAARAIAGAGYANAGQVCISAQRILTAPSIAGDFIDALKPQVESLKTGDPLDEATKVGPLVRQGEAERVERWIDEAVAEGATLVTGGRRDGAVYQPTILADVAPNQRISREELFGPAVAITRCQDINEAIHLANDTEYGLSAAIFTRDLARAMRFAQEVNSGNLHINWASQWRADAMPYGGLKHSGMGKEGPKYAIDAMTEEKMVVVHL
ncbi:MAG: aldehyde dehydrogenase family protein [Planctomycetaceae bacterium]